MDFPCDELGAKITCHELGTKITCHELGAKITCDELGAKITDNNACTIYGAWQHRQCVHTNGPNNSSELLMP